MNSNFNLHKQVASLVNAIVIGLIIYFVIKTDSDKSPIIFMVFYPTLTIFNFIIALLLGFLKMWQAKIYKQIVIVEIILFMPLILIITQF